MRSPVPPADRRYAGANDPRMERRMLAALIWTITAGTVALLAAAAIAAPRSALLFADKSPSALPVDVELVLAVDVSYSMVSPRATSCRRYAAASMARSR